MIAAWLRVNRTSIAVGSDVNRARGSQISANRPREGILIVGSGRVGDGCHFEEFPGAVTKATDCRPQFD